MKFIYTLILGLPLIALTSCGEHVKGNGNVVEVTHSLGNFNEIDIEGVFEVEMIKGGSSLEMITDENLHEFVSIEVVDDELRVSTNDKYLDTETRLLRIHYQNLREIDVSGAIEISATEAIKGKSFELDVSGACDGDLSVKVDELFVSIAGGGDIVLSGKSDEATFKISGASDIKAAELSTKNTSIDITGAGNVEVAVKDNLDVDITGAGDVGYSGDPEVSQSITGAGTVKKL